MTMRLPVTPSAIAPQLARMNAVFTKYKLDDLEGLAVGYAEALEDLDTEAVAGGVGLAIKEEPRFPVPSKLRELAKRWVAAARPTLLPAPVAAQDTGPQPVCQVCGAMPALAWLETRHWQTGETSQVKRFIAPCNARQHPAGTGFVPFPPNFLGWVDE